MKKRRMRKNILSNTIACLLIIGSVVLVIHILFVHLLPLTYIIPLALAGLFISLLVSLYHIKHKKSKPMQTISTIVVVCLFVFVCFTNYILLQIPATLHEVTSLANVSEEKAAVYIMKNKNAKNIKHLDGSVMGMMKSIDPQTAKALQRAMKKEKVQFQTKEYSSTLKMVQDLYDGKVGCIAMNCNYVDVIEENKGYGDFASEVRSVYSLKFEKRQALQIDENKEFKEEIPQPITMYIHQKGCMDEDILLAVHPEKKTVGIISIPSTYYLEIDTPNHKEKYDKMENIHLLGLEACQKSIEKALNVPIDYVMEVDYSKMESFVDAVGGLNINEAHMDGKAAVEYLKSNHCFVEGRILQALQDKMIKPTSFISYGRILKATKEVYKTNMPSDAIKQWVRYELENNQSWKFSHYELQGYISKKHCNQLGIETSVIMPNLESVQEARTKIIEIIEK